MRSTDGIQVYPLSPLDPSDPSSPLGPLIFFVATEGLSFDVTYSLFHEILPLSSTVGIKVYP